MALSHNPISFEELKKFETELLFLNEDQKRQLLEKLKHQFDVLNTTTDQEWLQTGKIRVIEY